MARDLQRDLAGAVVRVSSPQGRFLDAERVDRATLARAEAVGKHLLLHFTRGTVHVHLGLFGRTYRRKQPAPEPRASVRLRLEGAAHTWDIVGPTCCELLDTPSVALLRARLGADPLDPDANPELAWLKFQKSSRAVGAVLLDQAVISGIGNVYRAELLFMLGIHPATRCRDLSKAQFKKLWKLAATLLARGVKERRIVTTRAIKGQRLKRGEALHVYRRDHCRACQGPIRQLELGGRTIYACERCQPREAPRRVADPARAAE